MERVHSTDFHDFLDNFPPMVGLFIQECSLCQFHCTLHQACQKVPHFSRQVRSGQVFQFNEVNSGHFRSLNIIDLSYSLLPLNWDTFVSGLLSQLSGDPN